MNKIITTRQCMKYNLVALLSIVHCLVIFFEFYETTIKFFFRGIYQKFVESRKIAEMPLLINIWLKYMWKFKVNWLSFCLVELYEMKIFELEWLVISFTALKLTKTITQQEVLGYHSLRTMSLLDLVPLYNLKNMKNVH